jgi:hypothetical protein
MAIISAGVGKEPLAPFRPPRRRRNRQIDARTTVSNERLDRFEFSLRKRGSHGVVQVRAIRTEQMIDQRKLRPALTRNFA